MFSKSLSICQHHEHVCNTNEWWNNSSILHYTFTGYQTSSYPSVGYAGASSYPQASYAQAGYASSYPQAGYSGASAYSQGGYALGSSGAMY